MSLMNHGGSGGFGGGPPVYRGAHQQGTDGPPRRRRPRTTIRTRHRQPTNSLEAQIVSIATSDRKRLIGPRGCIVQRLTQSTGANIHVPKSKHKQHAAGAVVAVPLENNNKNDNNADDRITVYVKAATIASLLHALWSILELLRVEEDEAENDDNHNPVVVTSTTIQIASGIEAENDDNHNPVVVTSTTIQIASGIEEEKEDGNSKTASLQHIIMAPTTTTKTMMACRVRLGPKATPVSGRLVIWPAAVDPSNPFLTLENGLAVYCCRAAAADFTTEQLEMLLDNERFAHSEWTAGCEIVECCIAENENTSSEDDEVVESILIFIYGTESQYPKQLCQSLDRSIRDALCG